LSVFGRWKLLESLLRSLADELLEQCVMRVTSVEIKVVGVGQVVDVVNIREGDIRKPGEISKA